VTMRAGYWYYWVHGTEYPYRLLGCGSGWAGRNLRSRPTRASVYWRVWSLDTRLSDLLCPIFASWILPGRCRWRTTPGRSQNRPLYLPDSLCSLAGIPRNHAEQTNPSSIPSPDDLRLTHTVKQTSQYIFGGLAIVESGHPGQKLS
jgi:hypothetical protein